ncbi:MAG: histidine triad nucleotide-binding protein [bacterium]
MTLFEKIIAREIPASIVYEDEAVIAFHDIAPKAPVHILIVPKEPIPTLNDLTEENSVITSKMISVATKIAEQEGIDERGYRLVFNCNDDGGQSVPHLHCHLLGGRSLAWPPG